MSTPPPPQVLFTVTEEHLDTGLRGYPVGTCRTSSVDPVEGLHYVGYPIIDLKDLLIEDVIYLLFHKRLPTPEEGLAFRRDLAAREEVDPSIYRLLETLPRRGHPMVWFQIVLNWLGMTGATGDWREDALNLVARVNTVVAAIFHVREGWGRPIHPCTDLPLHANFVCMLGMPAPHPMLGELLRLFHVLHMDHGGGNLSTFVGKAVASGKADIYASMSGAMAALYGPRHGRANQECLEFVQSIGTTDPKRVQARVREILAHDGLVYGFGHAVLRVEDPRAAIQYEFAQRHFPHHPLVQTALALREVVPPILKENPKIQNPYPNVDAVSGTLLTAAGLDKPEYYTLLFGWSRIVGIAAQIVDERLVPGKKDGLPIYRPRYIAKEQPRRRLGA